jgi:hypothetical protein
MRPGALAINRDAMQSQSREKSVACRWNQIETDAPMHAVLIPTIDLLASDDDTAI